MMTIPVTSLKHCTESYISCSRIESYKTKLHMHYIISQWPSTAISSTELSRADKGSRCPLSLSLFSRDTLIVSSYIEPDVVRLSTFLELHTRKKLRFATLSHKQMRTGIERAKKCRECTRGRLWTLMVEIFCLTGWTGIPHKFIHGSGLL